MGKNQAYKAMQRSRVGSTSGGPEDVEDGMVDGSFHSPEWHAARLASLKTSHTVTWEEYKRKQKVFNSHELSHLGKLDPWYWFSRNICFLFISTYVLIFYQEHIHEFCDTSCLCVYSAHEEEELKKGELEADKDRMMREYRAQLDAERASKLAHGRNHSKTKSTHHRKDKKEKDLKKRTSKKRKHLRESSSSSSSESESSCTSSSDDDSKKSRSRSKKRKDKRRRHSSKSKHLSGEDEVDGPLPLSRFFGTAKG